MRPARGSHLAPKQFFKMEKKIKDILKELFKK